MLTRPVTASTLGSFLRTFTHGHVRQLQAAARQTMIGLAARVPLLAGADVLTFVDIDSMLRRVYGKRKQGIGFGHAKVGGYNVWLRGYNPLLATLSTPLSAPMIAATRLRSGSAGSARGAASMIAEAIGTARSCGATGEIVVRADSAFYAIEISARAGLDGLAPLPITPIAPDLAGLITHVWGYEELALDAALRGGRDRVYRALLAHPLTGRLSAADAAAGIR